MTDPIPQPIYRSLVLWLLSSRETKQACQINFHVNTEGKIVGADKVVKESVRAASGGVGGR